MGSFRSFVCLHLFVWIQTCLLFLINHQSIPTLLIYKELQRFRIEMNRVAHFTSNATERLVSILFNRTTWMLSCTDKDSIPFHYFLWNVDSWRKNIVLMVLKCFLIFLQLATVWMRFFSYSQLTSQSTSKSGCFLRSVIENKTGREIDKKKKNQVTLKYNEMKTR